MVECPNCKKNYDDDFDLCPYCGCMSPILKACPECLFETLEEEIFCQKCGAKLRYKIQLIKDLKDKISDYKKLGEYEKTLECYDKIIELDPTNKLSWEVKSNYLSGHAKYDEALELWDKAIELNSTEDWPWANKAYCLQDLKRFEEALECWDKAIELEPTNSWYWVGKAGCLKKLGRHDEAGKCFMKVAAFFTMAQVDAIATA